MVELFRKTLVVAKKQWLLFLITVITTVVSQIDYGLSDENFGYYIILFFPFVAWTIYLFTLPKLVAEKIENHKITLKEQSLITLDYIKKLFFPMIGLSILVVLSFFIVAIMTNGIVNLLGLPNDKSFFEAGPTDIKYLLGYLLLSFIYALLSFQSVLYFFEKQSFFRAAKNSIILSKDHLKLIIIVSIINTLLIVLSGFINGEVWYQNALKGIFDGINYFLIAVYILLYYQKFIGERM